MAEVNVVKETKPAAATRPLEAPVRPFGGMEPEFPLFRGSMFGLNPFALMRRFTEDMDRFFAQGAKAQGATAQGATAQGATEGFAAGSWEPAIEVKEEGGKLLVHAELPGLKKEDVKVSITDDLLTLEGERKHEKEEKREGYYHSERSYGKFARSVRLPEGAKADETTARFDNGVLEIAVPLAAAKKPNQKVIAVEDAAKAKAAS